MPQALPSAPRRLLTASLICLLSGAVLATDWQALNRVAQASAEQQAEAQREIEKLDDEAKKHFAEYRAQLIELDGLQTYNRQLKALRDEQDAALAELDERIQKTGRLDRKIIPLLEDMYSALVLFIEQDLPFLQRERKDRLAQLRHILDDPEVTLAAKYRSLYEAYQIELDYGRTLESYSDMLELEGETRAVTILRIGTHRAVLNLRGPRAGFHMEQGHDRLGRNRGHRTACTKGHSHGEKANRARSVDVASSAA